MNLHRKILFALIAVFTGMVAAALGFQALRSQLSVVTIAWNALMAIVGVVSLYSILTRWLLRPLSQLRENMDRLCNGEEETENRPQAPCANDFERLDNQLVKMASKLHSTQHRLAVMSREAGMADAATSVIHNIGNVITNVNVLHATMRQRVETSKVTSLRRAAELLDHHASDIDTFLLHDARGKQLPRFLTTLSDTLEQEHGERLTHLQSMTSGLQHINELLESQQRIGQHVVTPEPVSVSRLVKDAVEMLRASLDRESVMALTVCEQAPAIVLDQSKVMQVLVNLIANARDAVKDLDPSRRQIRIEVSTPVESYLSIDVIDQGCGIASEDLSRVFSSGFTTKPDGHGQGLHFCAIAAEEMNGSLRVSSGGVGEGARFTLSLPRVVKEEWVPS
ncbi:sensor histidine kinase [Novipirellula artificiosorum]|uniref:histidine kinase n=1 Tax=Novipirellula artificiosorum TaxID=2528016 RepID=A0A5C6DKM0_9BACT|nr:ATP-binding protein [Novipirellula artificiosorum]TWU36181.1 Sensor histidine kinase TodS [Novipirellula artificiosorum]